MAAGQPVCMSDHWISATYRSDPGWSLLESLVDIGSRMPGSEGERRGAEAVESAFDAIGLDPVVTSFSIRGWFREDSAIRTAEQSHSCIALPRSPADTVSGPLVDVGYGLPEEFDTADLEGAIALVRSDVPEYHDRYIHRREKYYRAIDAGAVGFIYRNHVDGQLPPTGSVGGTDHPIGPVPAVGVSAEVGARLARRYASDAVTLSVNATIEETTSYNVHATLGPDTDERVLLTAHHDAHDIAEGALDNAAGAAAVLEAARALQYRESELDYGIECIVFGAEEVGLLGSSYDAANRDHPVRAVLNSDAIVAGRDLKVHTHGSDALADAATAAADTLGYPITVTPQHNPHSDHWPYVRRGVPGVMILSDTDGTGRGWGHTAADTIDKLDRRNLQEQSLFLTEFAVQAGQEKLSVPRREQSAIAAELESQQAAEGMRYIGSWPFADVTGQ